MRSFDGRSFDDEHDDRPSGGSELSCYFSPIVHQSTPYHFKNNAGFVFCETAFSSWRLIDISLHFGDIRDVAYGARLLIFSALKF